MSHRTAARLAWSLCAVCVALLGLALLLDFLTDELIPTSLPGQRLGPAFALLTGVLSLASPTVGALIASRLPTNPIGWILCGVGLLYTGQRFSIAYADYALLESFAFPGDYNDVAFRVSMWWSHASGGYVAWFSGLIDFEVFVLAGVFVMLLFPDGRLLSPRWRIVAWMAVCGAVLTTLYDAFYEEALATHSWLANPFRVVEVIGGRSTTYEFFEAETRVGEAFLLASILAALISLFLRLHRAQGDERQQLKWFLCAAVPAVVGFSLVLLSYNIVAYLNVPLVLFWEIYYYIRYVPVFSLLFVPVFTYIAIVRYRLYDIDVVINRTLVYGSLSACVVGIYVLVVVALGAVFQAQGNLAISLLATGFVAVLFQPLRMRLQRSVNRLMYGERDDPYAVISRLGRRLEATLAPEAVLPTVVETIAQALKLPYAAILLKEGEGFRTAAAYGSPRGEPETLPLVYQREEIGRLELSPRAPGEGFSDADRNLLEDLARQAEVAVHAVRLTSDLQHSRERLVATREEERRRLRRDLHDGVGPTLTGLALQLNAARKLVGNKPQDAEATLTRLEERTQETLGEMRRLIYGLRPPALDDLGLVPSIYQQAQNQSMAIMPTGAESEKSQGNRLIFSIEAPEELPPLPAAVEVACYRIAQEAMTNVARHAHARTCHVRLSMDEAASTLGLEISDDGVGIPEDRVAGVGLSSMRERAEELGGTLAVEIRPEGGTRVLACLPLSARVEQSEGVTSSWNARSVS